jgi:catechol 2,3-dioxygenase-like lactoylglutathione lyase family enzyme
MTTTIFGQFLEFSVPTHDIQESLNFYHELGFTELSVGDIRNYHYGIVTDGRIAIGLHAGGIDEPALSFVKSDVASYLQQVTPNDEELSFSRLGTETFHEIGVHTPDGHLLIMMEARTFSRVRLSDLPTPVTGYSVEISLGCSDIDNAARYWTDAGFMAARERPEYAADAVVELLAPGLRLGLRTDLPPGRSVLCFAPDDLNQTLESLDQRNVPVRRIRAGHRQVHRMTAPEGTHLDLVVPED